MNKLQRFNFEAQAQMPEQLELGDEYEIRALSEHNRVLRYGFVVDENGAEYYGRWYMELSVADGDISRIDGGGCPLLYQHGWQHLGVVTQGKKEKELRLGVRWTSVPDSGQITKAQEQVKELWRGVQERTRNAYSIGFEYGGLKRQGKFNGLPVFRATDWTLLEVSLVDVGAVGSATRLSATDAELEHQHLYLMKEKLMDPKDGMENSISGNDEMAQFKAQLKAEMDEQLKNAKAQLKAEMDQQLAQVKAEGTVRLMQTRGIVKEGDDVPAKLAPALLAVPNLEEFLTKPAQTGKTGGRQPLNQPAVGGKRGNNQNGKGGEFDASQVLEQAAKEGVDPYSLIEDDEAEGS